MDADSPEPLELCFLIEHDAEADVFVASWDDPAGGGITTQADTLATLPGAVQEAVRCHFADHSRSRVTVALHFEADPVLQVA